MRKATQVEWPSRAPARAERPPENSNSQRLSDLFFAFLRRKFYFYGFFKKVLGSLVLWFFV